MTGTDPEVGEERTDTARRQEWHADRRPLAPAETATNATTAQRDQDRDAIRPRRGRDGAGQSGQRPSPIEQEEQARRGGHDHERLGVRHRQHEGSGEEHEQRRGAVRLVATDQASGELPNEHGRGRAQNERHDDGGVERRQARHRGDAADQGRKAWKERDVGEMVAVLRRSRIAAIGDPQIPSAVPLREHPLERRAPLDARPRADARIAVQGCRYGGDKDDQPRGGVEGERADEVERPPPRRSGFDRVSRVRLSRAGARREKRSRFGHDPAGLPGHPRADTGSQATI